MPYLILFRPQLLPMYRDFGFSRFIYSSFVLIYRHEKAMEEWRSTICELSEKSEDNFLLANIWLTTNSGEIHKAGQIKIAGKF